MNQIPIIQVEDDKIQRMQDGLVNQLNQISKKVILDGNLLKNVSLVGTHPNVIAHKLGRDIQGYFVTNPSSGANIWRTDASLPSEPGTYLKLSSSADTTV